MDFDALMRKKLGGNKELIGVPEPGNDPASPWIWPWASHHQLQYQSTCKTKVSIFLLSRRTQDPRRQVRRDRWP